jgi:hypothetical protein
MGGGGDAKNRGVGGGGGGREALALVKLGGSLRAVQDSQLAFLLNFRWKILDI